MPQLYNTYRRCQVRTLFFLKNFLSHRWNLNPQPVDYKSTALPIELQWQALRAGIEPATIPLTAERSSSELP